MTDWPKKMWAWPLGQTYCADEVDQSDGDAIPVLVYPADQAPEPVAWRLHELSTGWRGSWQELPVRAPSKDSDEEGFEIEVSYLAPPAESAKIDRLRAENEKLMRWAMKSDKSNDELKAENAKMAELLVLARQDEMSLRAENASLKDKALRYDLDQAGITQRESEAVELVELRAENARLEKKLKQALGPTCHMYVARAREEHDFEPACVTYARERDTLRELVRDLLANWYPHKALAERAEKALGN